MPNRLIRDSIHTSESVNQMTDFQFRLWVNLITYVDDYGRGDARAAVIKGQCFPLRERLTVKDVENALMELAGMGCIRLYEVDGKSYLYFPTWAQYQVVRNQKSRYPAPSENNCKQLQAIDSKCFRNPIQSESNPNPNPTSNPTARAEDDADDEPTHDVFADKGNEADPYDPALSDDWVKVVKAYETNIGMMPNLGSASGSDLISYYGEMGADVLIAAIEATSRAAPSNPARYLTAILRKWSEAGVKNKDAAQAMIQDHARQTQQTQPQTRAAPAKHNPALDYLQRPVSEEEFRPTSAEELDALMREMDERRKARMEGGTS